MYICEILCHILITLQDFVSETYIVYYNLHQICNFEHLPRVQTVSGTDYDIISTYSR